MVLKPQFRGIVLKITVSFFHLPPTSSHLHPLQVENCGSNSWLVVDDDDYGKVRPERVKTLMSRHSVFLLAPV